MAHQTVSLGKYWKLLPTTLRQGYVFLTETATEVPRMHLGRWIFLLVTCSSENLNANNLYNIEKLRV